jgi:hypothetical protein
MGKWFAPTAVRPTYVLEGTKRPLILLLLSFNKHNRYHLQFQTNSEISSSAICNDACPTQGRVSYTKASENSDEDQGEQGGENADCDPTFEAS